ncbi:MAG: hypothetical protein LBC60_09500 [Spirochaetaceae bacterium]|jgi:hypothetical protein|nr:hypothetical protein [Spirochaetaceae bacterium]
MKKSLLFLLIAVVSAGFIMVGCSQSDDPVTAVSGGPIGGETTVTIKSRVTANELADLLADNAVVTLVGDYKETIVIYDTKDGTIQPTTLHVTTDRTLVVGKNVTLIFDDDHLSVEPGGKVRVAKDGALVMVNSTTATPNPFVSTGDLRGEIVVEEGGLFIDMNSTGTLWGATPQQGTGKITYQAGAIIYGAGGGAAYYTTPATDPVTAIDLTTAAAKAQKRFGPKDDPDATIQLLSGDFIQRKTTYELDGDAVLAKNYGVTSDLTLQINEGKTATLKAPFALVVDIGETTSGKLTGAGKLVAGSTEFSGGTGGWQAVLSAANAAVQSVAIIPDPAVDAAALVIVSDADVVLTGGAGGSITQKIGPTSALTVGDATTEAVINLGGTVTYDESNRPIPVAGAQLILKGDPNWTASSTIAGSVILANTDSVILGGASAGVAFGTNAFTTAAKIGGRNIAKISATPPTASSTQIHTDTQGVGPTPAAGNFVAIAVGTANDGIASGSTEDLIIDSTQRVE